MANRKTLSLGGRKVFPLPTVADLNRNDVTEGYPLLACRLGLAQGETKCALTSTVALRKLQPYLSFSRLSLREALSFVVRQCILRVEPPRDFN
jgi:hypothetical protein